VDADADAGQAAFALDPRRDAGLDRELDDLAGEPQHEGARLQLVSVGRVNLNPSSQAVVVHHGLDIEILGMGARPEDVASRGGGIGREPLQEDIVQRQVDRRRGPGRLIETGVNHDLSGANRRVDLLEREDHARHSPASTWTTSLRNRPRGTHNRLAPESAS
jgi:hypothetical protein